LELNNVVVGKETTSHVAQANGLESGGGTNNVSDDRPEGRDSAKRRCFKKDAESSSSDVVEVLQRIHDNRQKSQLKEDE
jgi:hypothetical protein